MNRYAVISISLLIFAFGYWFNGVLTERALLQKQVKEQKQLIEYKDKTSNFYNTVTKQVIDYKNEQQLKNEERKVEYKEIIKKEFSCNYYIPKSISDGLLDYTGNLRQNANPSRVDDARNRAISRTGRITYCSAVLWIDDLLTVIDKEQRKLAAIREIENER